MSTGERIYRGLAILVVAAITATTAALIAAIALVARPRQKASAERERTDRQHAE